jgi:hypothetical protein
MMAGWRGGSPPADALPESAGHLIRGTPLAANRLRRCPALLRELLPNPVRTRKPLLEKLAFLLVPKTYFKSDTCLADNGLENHGLDFFGV